MDVPGDGIFGIVPVTDVRNIPALRQRRPGCDGGIRRQREGAVRPGMDHWERRRHRQRGRQVQPFDLQRVGVVARLLRGQGHDQAAFGLAKGQFFGRAEQRDGLDSADQARRILGQGANRELAVIGPAERRGVEDIAFGCKPEVFGRIGACFLNVCPAGDFDWPFAVELPGARGEDRFAVDFHPGRHALQEG